MNSRNILIISASTGTGHVRAASALQHAMLSEHPEWNVAHADILDLAPRWVRTAYGNGFELIASHAPQVWRGIYRLSDGPDADPARWGAAARRVLFRRFAELMKNTRWDHIVCTHFLPAQLAARHAAAPPFTLVVTDFALHRYWVQHGIANYCVATEAMASELKKRLPRTHVTVTGIPVDSKFSDGLDRRSAREQLGLSADRRVALIVGGGLGIGVEEAVRTCLADAPPDVQLVAVCGRNEAAFERLKALELPTERLAVFGYVNAMERFFAAADVIVSKPGGLTCSEALAACRPLVLTRPIPGHEEGNIDVLTAAGAALNGCTPVQLAHAMRAVFTQAGMLEQLTNAARNLGRPDAARVITSQLSQHLEQGAAA